MVAGKIKYNVWSIILSEHRGELILLREATLKKWWGNGGVEKEKYFIPNIFMYSEKFSRYLEKHPRYLGKK